MHPNNIFVTIKLGIINNVSNANCQITLNIFLLMKPILLLIKKWAVCLIILTTCPIVSLYAQDRYSVSGQITDENGEILAGVSVIVKGTSNGTTSNVDGRYSLTVSKSDIIQFSFMGMETLEITADGRQTMNIILKSSSIGLDESIVVGYGSIIRRDLSSSVSSVSTEALNERATSANIMQSLAGKVAGLRSASFSVVQVELLQFKSEVWALSMRDQALSM